MSLTWSSCSSDRNLCSFTTWEVFLERTDNILGRGPVWLYSVCVCSCLCVQPIRWALTGPVVSIRPADQLSLLICWDWLACRCNSLHQSPSARVCLVGSGTSACHFYTSEGRDGVGGNWVSANVSCCEVNCRCDQIPPNTTTTCLMLSQSCENKNRIYTRKPGLWSGLNGNVERMWQSHHERQRTTEHQAYIWLNQNWYGRDPYGRSKKQKCRWQERLDQVISHGRHSQTLPWGAGLGCNNIE